MKKNTLILICFVTILLGWCFNSNSNIENINPENEKSAEESFNTQIDQAQYLIDLENFISYDVLSITDNKPYTSELSISADFDENSSVQWGFDFSQKKVSKAYDNESSDIEFNIIADWTDKSLEPFEASWSILLLYQNKEMYANLHNLGVFMWEWNMTAKMYTLLWNSLVDKWVNLEINSWWIVSVDKEKDSRIVHILWTIKNVLKTEDIQDSPNFLWSIIELLDTMNSYIDLWVSTNELRLIKWDISYSKLSNDIIQKTFVWEFQWKDSAFDFSFSASKKWLEMHLYNIKEYDEDVSDYIDIDSEFSLSIQEDGRSEYSVDFKSIKYEQTVADLHWKLDYDDIVKFSADFVLEPLEIVAWQKIEWELKWNINKKSWVDNQQFPELSWEIVSISEILSSL